MTSLDCGHPWIIYTSTDGPIKIANRYDPHCMRLELILNVLLFKNILYHKNVMAKLC